MEIVSDKRVELKILKDEMGAAELPLMPANLVFGEGNPDADVMFIGEAPGVYEDMQQRPFVGRGGQLLDSAIRDIGWKRDNVYITNIVKRRPPENRDPVPEEIDAYAPYLLREIAIVDPKVIAPLGRYAMNYFLAKAKMSKDQGVLFEKNERLIFPLFHPAAALRSTGVLEAFRKSFHSLPKIISGDWPFAPKHVENEAPPQSSLF